MNEVMKQKMNEVIIAKHGIRINEIFISQTSLNHYIELVKNGTIQEPKRFETKDNLLGTKILETLYEYKK